MQGFGGWSAVEGGWCWAVAEEGAEEVAEVVCCGVAGERHAFGGGLDEGVGEGEVEVVRRGVSYMKLEVSSIRMEWQ